MKISNIPFHATAIALTACGQKEPVLILPPADLATCAAMPDAPDIPERDGANETQLERDRMTLAYILDLRSAYGDCAAKVMGLAAWRETAGK